jgi:hypothetical protein
MNWFWMNVPLMVVFAAAWTGIPLWLVVKHPDTGPQTLVPSIQATSGAAEAILLLAETELVSAA